MTSLKEMQARAREEFDKVIVHMVIETEPNRKDFDDFIDSLVARVRTETLDAVEAGMPEIESYGDKFLPCRYCGGKYNYACECASALDNNRDEMLAHLRALREGNK